MSDVDLFAANCCDVGAPDKGASAWRGMCKSLPDIPGQGSVLANSQHRRFQDFRLSITRADSLLISLEAVAYS